MKKVFCAILALVMVLSLAACGGNESSTGQPSSGSQDSTQSDAQSGTTEPKIADTIVVAYGSGPSILDPVMIPGDNSTIWLTDLLFGTLVRPSTNGTEILPWLADSWEANEDGSVYTFHLKDGVKFSDGTDVTVEDWVFSLLRARDTEESNWHTSTDAIGDVVAVDEKTLEIQLVAPRESFLSEIGMFNNAVQSKAYVESIGDEANQTAPMGTGPYMISDWVIGDHITFEKNPYYWDADNVPTQYIRFNMVTDPAARMLQLESGEADIINDVPFNSIAQLEAMDGVTAYGVDSSETQLLCLNVKDEILSDLRVRQALRYATDMQTIVDLVLAGYGTVATSYLPPTGLYYNKDIKPSPYDVEKAKELLAEAGYPDGVKLTLLLRSGRPTYEEIATILKDQWSAAGIELEIQPIESTAFLEARNTLNFQMTFVTWTDDIPHPSQISNHAYFFDMEHGLFTNYSNPEGYEILKKAFVELDPEKCAEYYGELQQIWFDDIPMIILYYGTLPVAHSESLRNFEQTSMGRYRLEHCYKEIS